MSDKTGGYILHIASWYPHEESPFEGDFVERHIRCISTNIKGVVYFSKPVVRHKNKIDSYEETNISIYKRLFKRASTLSNYIKYHSLASLDLKTIITQHGSPSAIHCHAGYPGLSLAVSIGIKHKVPIIYTEHSTIYQQEHLSFKEKLMLWYLKKYIPKVDIICPVSLAHENAISAKCKFNSSQVVHNVVSDKFYETLLTKSKKPHRLLHISSLDDDQKNISDILKAFKILRANRPDSVLTIVGNSNIKQTKRLIKKHKLDTKNVKVIGPVTHTAIPQILTDHDLFILWSRYESFSLVIAESWACGVPVVSNNSGGITSENNDRLGNFVYEYTPEALANAISYTLNRYSEFDLNYIRNYSKSRYSSDSVSHAYQVVYKSAKIM